MNNTTYYQRNRDVILDRVKDYHEHDKEDSESKQEINTEIYLKKIKLIRENITETDAIICLKKRNRD